MPKLSNLFSRFVAAKDPSLTIGKESLTNADAGLIVDAEQQPGILGRSLISQAGGYHYKYYPRDEIAAATTLVGLKFLSVSLVTFSFMKALYPAFENQLLARLPQIGNVDAKYIIMGGVSAAAWWGISKLDTAVMHNLRSRKAAERAEKELGIVNPDANRSSLPDYTTRIGVSMGSLIISIPTLLVTASQETIDQHERDRIFKGNNQAIIEKYNGRLLSIEGEIAKLTQIRVSFDQRIAEIDANRNSIPYTDAQKARLELLNQRQRQLEEQKILEQQRQIEQERLRDDVQAKIDQERNGTHNSKRGCRPEVPVAPKCDTYMGDRDNILRRIQTILTNILRIESERSAITDEIQSIQNSARDALRLKNEAEDKLRETILLQINKINEAINVQQKLIGSASDVQKLAENDPAFIQYRPDFTSRSNVYVDQVLKKSSLFDWAGILGLTLIIACAELGVFMTAAGRKASSGEVKGYLADILKTRAAHEIFKQSVDKVNLQAEAGMDEELRDLARKIKIIQATEEHFDDALKQAKENPEFMESLAQRVYEEMKRHTYKEPQDTTMSDIPRADATVNPAQKDKKSPSNGTGSRGPAPV